MIDVPITVAAGPPSESLTPLDPSRILDTRTGGATGDDLFEGIGIREAGTTLELQVAGRGNVPADAVGAVLNITATDGTGPGYVTVYPCGRPRPEASSVNFIAGAPAPTTVVAAIGDGGKVCLYTALSSVHLIADANGFVGVDSGYLPLNPARLADSRAGSVDDRRPVPGRRSAGGRLGVGDHGRWPWWCPDDADSAALNVTTTGATETGYATVWPCDAPQPLASSVNFTAGQDVPNAVTVPLSPRPGRSVCTSARRVPISSSTSTARSRRTATSVAWCRLDCSIRATPRPSTVGSATAAHVNRVRSSNCRSQAGAACRPMRAVSCST